MKMRSVRAIAVAIVVAGIIDPAITTSRRVKPDIAVLTSDSLHASTASQVARELSSMYRVVRAHHPAASATVLVGDYLPSSIAGIRDPVFAVIPETPNNGVRIHAVVAPTLGSMNSRIAINVSATTSGQPGDTMHLELHSGSIVLDRIAAPVVADDATHELQLSFVPFAAGPIGLRVTAQLGNRRQSIAPGGTASADFAIDVVEKKWAVLFVDRRPSWMSTFVRRTLESDPRFVVTSRVVTSRSVSRDAGTPPSALDDAASIDLFDAVVVGAPETLTERDADGLEGFLRRRGGSVVLLLDSHAGGVTQRLTRVREWETAATGRISTIASTTTASARTFRASEFTWPLRMPAGAHALAVNGLPSDSTADLSPIVWRAPFGAGRLVVSGALDSWRFRADSNSAFADFWLETIAGVAEEAPRPFSLALARNVLRPGEKTVLVATLRDFALAERAAGRKLRTSVTAVMASGASRDTLVLLPTEQLGVFEADVTAPAAPGVYRINAVAGGPEASVPLLVESSTSHPTPSDTSLLAGYARSHGGNAFSASELGTMKSALASAVAEERRPETWHPMRSAWWIVPVTLLLGMEWWWRRRVGLA